MRDLLALLAHLMTLVATLLGPGGVKAVVAESLLLKHQLLIINRPRKRAPNLDAFHRLLLGFWTLFLYPRRILRSAVILKPSTLFRFHTALKMHKYPWLYSRPWRHKPGPKGPAPGLIRAIVELKRRNPCFGCPRIAQQLGKTFGVAVDKDVVRRILAAHYRPGRGGGGPSWLTVLGHAKDSLWSMDLFRVESVLLRTHWILVVMDQFTRRIIGFGIHTGTVDGVALCRMFNHAISGHGLPVRLSLDHDPLFRFERWQANLRILEIETIRTVPHVPLSHPFIERLVGTIRREYLDAVLFWNGPDLERKLEGFKNYFNEYRVHQGLGGDTPGEVAAVQRPPQPASLLNYKWRSHCNGLFELPIAA